VGKVNAPSALTTCESRPSFTKVTLPDNPVTVPPIVAEGGLEFESLHPLIDNAIAPQARIDCSTRIVIFTGAPIDRSIWRCPRGSGAAKHLEPLLQMRRRYYAHPLGGKT
jgi:hypothetical protein